MKLGNSCSFTNPEASRAGTAYFHLMIRESIEPGHICTIVLSDHKEIPSSVAWEVFQETILLCVPERQKHMTAFLLPSFSLFSGFLFPSFSLFSGFLSPPRAMQQGEGRPPSPDSLTKKLCNPRQITLPLWTSVPSPVNERPDLHQRFSDLPKTPLFFSLQNLCQKSHTSQGERKSNHGSWIREAGAKALPTGPSHRLAETGHENPSDSSEQFGNHPFLWFLTSFPAVIAANSLRSWTTKYWSLLSSLEKNCPEEGEEEGRGGRQGRKKKPKEHSNQSYKLQLSLLSE